METAVSVGVKAVGAVVEKKMEQRADEQYAAEVEAKKQAELKKNTKNISIGSEVKAVLEQQSGAGEDHEMDKTVDLRQKAEYKGLVVEATPQILEGIMLCQQKKYPKAMRILRKNTETPGTVNWCRMQLFSSYATFFHCSHLYFLNKDLAKKELQRMCCPKPAPYIENIKQMKELIRQSLHACHEVAQTVLDAEKSINGEELDLTCQMCFSIMSLGNAYKLEEERFLDKALGLASVWSQKRGTVLAATEKAIIESKRLEDPLKKISESMDGISRDIQKLSKKVQDQGDPIGSVVRKMM